jgi:threonine dehydratase
MLALLDSCFAGLDVVDFQYGKSGSEEAWPVFTLSAENQLALDALPGRLEANGFGWEDLGEDADLAFRAIPLRSDLLAHPAFLRLDFYERPGALHDFLAQRIRGLASLCYFNYRQSGERIGRALIGIEFPSPYERDAFLLALPPHGEGYRLCEPLDADSAARITGLHG